MYINCSKLNKSYIHGNNYPMVIYTEICAQRVKRYLQSESDIVLHTYTIIFIHYYFRTKLLFKELGIRNGTKNFQWETIF